MALVLLGGLVTSTLLGVFLLPALYRRARTPDEAEPRESVPAPEPEVVR
jgi:Cu/Ag efflux pump CusA